MTRTVTLLLAILALAHQAGAGDFAIVQKEKSFSEKEIRIQAGDRILFRNEDTVVHNMFSRTPGLEFELKVQLPGQETPVAFDRPGEADVRCAIHPGMKLHVVVEPKPSQRAAE